MTLVFTPNGWAGDTHCQSADRATLRRINRLVDDALRDPVAGTGKPEPLRHRLSGGVVTTDHRRPRLVYLVDGDESVVLQARFHYD
jgi:toxin YoeB